MRSIRCWAEIASSAPDGRSRQVKDGEFAWTREEKALRARHAPDSVDRLTGLLVVCLLRTGKNDDRIVLDEEHFLNADATCEGKPLPSVDPVLGGNAFGSVHGIQQRALLEAEVGIRRVEQFTSGIHTDSIAGKWSDLTPNLWTRKGLRHGGPALCRSHAS